MTNTQIVAGLRSAIGVSAWGAPVLASKAFGLDVSDDVSAKLYLRLGGTRDLALAAGTLAPDPATRRHMIKVAAACDVADIAAAVIAHRTGKLSALGTALFLGASAACLAAGAKALAE